jgi:hypothetical protein
VGVSHSYYLTNGYYQSLSDAGFNCELLSESVALRHRRRGSGVTSFDLDGAITPGRDVRPYFSIFNNSDREVTDAEINLLLLKPQETRSIIAPFPSENPFILNPNSGNADHSRF